MTPETTETFAELAIPTNPFPGLRPFDFDESHLFFGRDGQSEQLIGKLSRTHFLAVVGTSGSGKSSLVRAGLMPALLGGFMSSAGSNWRIAITRPGNDPIGNLARSLNAPDVFGSEVQENATLQTALAEATLQRGSRGLVDTVRQSVISENESVLIIVDQFEELFRFARVTEDRKYGNEAAAFVKLLLEAARQREVPIYVVLTMRSDYLGDCSQFWGLPEAINESQYLIPRLTRDQLREAMSGPINVAHGQITPRLVARLLNDVGDDQDQLPVLQHLLMRIWDEAKEKRLEIEADENGKTVKYQHRQVHHGKALDVCCYDAVGGMANALSRHADEAFNELPNDRSRALAESIFKALTEKGTDNREIRRPVTLGELCAVVAGTQDEIITVIESFRRPGRSFLMPPVETDLNSKSLIDISHESLIRGWSRLKAWVDEEARSSRIYSRVAETAVLHSEGGAGLWRDPDLQIALTWRERSKPNETWARRYHQQFNLAMAFLDQSVAERDAEKTKREEERKKQIRRTQLTAIVMAIGCLAAIIGGSVGFVQARRARAALVEAERQKHDALLANALAQESAKDADRERIRVQATLRDIEIQKGLTDKALDEAKQQKLAAETNLAEAKRQRSVAQTALQRQTSEALKGQGLSALREENETEAITQFTALHNHAQKIGEPSSDVFALTSIADIYRDHVPLFLVLPELSDFGQQADPDDGDSATAMKQYCELTTKAALQKDKDDDALRADILSSGKQAVDKYEAALAANKATSGREFGLRQGYILQNLGELALIGASDELEPDAKPGVDDSAAFEVKRKAAIDRALSYYAQARDAYHQAELYEKEGELLKKTAALVFIEWKRRNPSALATPVGPAATPSVQAGPPNLPSELEQIVSLYDQAGTSFKRAGKPLREAAMFLLIAKLYKDLPAEHTRNAINYSSRALNIYDNEKNFAKIASTSEDLAKLYEEISDTPNQIAALKNALTAYRHNAANKSPSVRKDIDAKVSLLVRNIGELIRERDEAATDPFFKELIESSSGVERANIISSVVQFYKQHGQNDSALRYLNQKTEVFKQLGDRSEEADTLFELGQLRLEMNQRDEAVKAFDAAFVGYRESPRQMKNYSDVDQMVGNLMRIASVNGADEQKVIAVYEEALRISFERKTLTYNGSAVLSALGRRYLEMKTPEGNRKATQLFQSALDTFTSVPTYEAELRTTIGDVYKTVGNKVEARASYDRALAIYRTKEFASNRHTDLLAKIGAMEIEGDPQATLGTFYVSRADSARQAGDVMAQALALELAAGYYGREKEPQKALSYSEQARELYHTAGPKYKEVNMLRTLATMYDSSGDKQKADDLRKQATQLESSSRPSSP